MSEEDSLRSFLINADLSHLLEYMLGKYTKNRRLIFDFMIGIVVRALLLKS